VLSDDVLELGQPILADLVDWPYWAGLSEGSLPGAALTRFVQQDADFLLPAFGRAFARCAADPAAADHAALLIRCSFETVRSGPRLRETFIELASEMDLPPLAEEPPAPTTIAYTDTVRASGSLPATLGIVLPFMWLHIEVCADLATREVAGSRYLPWIDVYTPGDGTRFAVRAFLGLVDEFGERASANDRAELCGAFRTGARYELAFARAMMSGRFESVR